jgi:hypothetical protein
MGRFDIALESRLKRKWLAQDCEEIRKMLDLRKMIDHAVRKGEVVLSWQNSVSDDPEFGAAEGYAGIYNGYYAGKAFDSLDDAVLHLCLRLAGGTCWRLIMHGKDCGSRILCEADLPDIHPQFEKIMKDLAGCPRERLYQQAEDLGIEEARKLPDPDFWALIEDGLSSRWRIRKELLAVAGQRPLAMLNYYTGIPVSDQVRFSAQR